MKRFATAAFAALMLASAAPALAQEVTTEEAPASQVFINPYAVMQITAAVVGEMNRSSSLEVSCTRLQRDNDRWQRVMRMQLMMEIPTSVMATPAFQVRAAEFLTAVNNHHKAIQVCNELFPPI